MEHDNLSHYHEQTPPSSSLPAENVSPSTLIKQKRLGPAPIASFEDTTAEEKNRMDTPGQNFKSRRYSSKETADSPKKQSPSNTVGSTSALAPSTPRIDISRASSHSSHHDSRDSSPENVFDQVGTGTLQDTGVLGYREEGAMDLRSSTEELQFMEPEKGRTEREKPHAPRYSPIMFKLDEQQQQISAFHQRKDSASSDVAAFLCISGRTSRISSVGSQGSANSKLSGVSGISRSPSPHRMLLETSFCGPKPLQGATDSCISSSIEPLTAQMLEQVILSRKKDPTEAVLAEGISIDTSLTNNVNIGNVANEAEPTRRKSDSNANVTRKEEIIQIPQTSRSISNKRYIPPTDLNKPIVGVMPSGAEYIRIKLKPDHCYSDNGIADNERVLDDDQKKPNSLNLENSHKKSHSSNVSPKPTRQSMIFRDSNSRSPSPANTTFSRKSSFCSIFKRKDSASPDSPGACHARKKSSSTVSHEFRERSRSKSRERDPTSVNSTPNQQKSVLAIFKPKKNGLKSKSPSPNDPYPQSVLADTANVEFKFRNDSSNDSSRSHLRYYDTPLDGKSIHIPLHTPPEEKNLKSLLSTPVPKLNTESEIIPGKVSPSTQSINLSNNCTVTIHNRPKPMPPLKCYRIENPDGSITIPLKSPTEEKERDSLWSMDVQRNSSQESQETVISAVPPQHSNTQLIHTHALPSSKHQNGVTQTKQDDAGAASLGNSKDNGSVIANMTAKERKQLLFSMKMGSGSQEQVFTTQFSISKTESQCSQLSEAINSAAIETGTLDRKDTTPLDVTTVVYRNKQLDNVKHRRTNEQCNRTNSLSGDSMEFQRHSRYIENPEEVLNLQYREENLRRENELQSTHREESSGSLESKNVLKVHDRKPTNSNDEQAVSSESEKDSEMDSTTTCKHIHSSMLAIEDHESAGLVLQESFDDELPYIPTTLPEERSIGVKLVPMKERAQIEMKTCPLERPRSTTPIHPASLENYCGFSAVEDTDSNLVRGEKLRISLPKKHDSTVERPSKSWSPRKASISSGKNWFEFVEQGISSTNQASATNNGEKKASAQQSNVEEEPPPLPPRKTAQQWIDFESIPEKRKQPKRITSLRQKESSVENTAITEVLYNYVKPEECQCECHESERESGKPRQSIPHGEIEDQQPLLQQDLMDEFNKRDDDSLHTSLKKETDEVSPAGGEQKP
ncbi:uncharacterized protein LOC129721023 isoform X2 [Wyeomyia smithii]|uniref:uncharacterized protein LOC129721023 isoform X2 n=1 Tax=Wyeomyia smithii TaxID=174621 RepID=UPI002467B61B|nr:uncharacterized protein LOC129721023 isoform X2 [Wyeomyia smithii]